MRLCPCTRKGLSSKGLSLASDIFCVLGLEPCALDYTSLPCPSKPNFERLSQARSQDLEKGGGYFKRVRKVQTTLTRIFMSLNQFHTVCPKTETKFFGKLGNSKVFSAQNKVVPPKKKVFTEIESDFSAEIRNSKVFSAQKKVVSKKKKRSSPQLRVIFRPKSEIQRYFSPKIRWSPKKKKKALTEIESDFSAKIRNSKVFSAQNKVVSKNKKIK